MQISLRRISLVLGCLLALSACGPSTVTLRSSDGSSTVSVRVEIADAPKEREKGLMGRENLAPDTGMLFVFPKAEMLRFWMKDTKVPLDILFFDDEGAFVSYEAMQPCIADPCPVYPSASVSSLALEVPQGFREAHKVGVGWTIDLKAVRKISRPT